MSRSLKKTKIFSRSGGHRGLSEKRDKRINNRIFRHKETVKSDEIVSELFKTGIFWFEQDYDIIETTYKIDMNEVRSIWSMSKDGKEYWLDAPKKYMRK